MPEQKLTEKAEAYLKKLCIEIPNRNVGRPGNRQATAFFKETIEAFEFQVREQWFQCMDWEAGPAVIRAGGRDFAASVSPYSLGCQCKAALKPAATVAELEKIEVKNDILLIHGELAKERLMPKHFVFFNPDEHRRIYQLLEAKAPAAIVTATGKNPELAGSLYPFAMIEDGDFDIPSVYLTDQAGEELRRYCGQTVEVSSESKRIPSTGCNVLGNRKGTTNKNVVICAHIDVKDNTPGALDNGSGIVILMLVAELLRNRQTACGVELVALNGEDYYAASGQMKYLADREGFHDVALAINSDGTGYHKGDTAFSLYECDEALAATIRSTLGAGANLHEGEPWPQSDHMIFVQNGCPAVAFISDRTAELFSEIIHTPRDIPALVDCSKLASVAEAIVDLVGRLGR